MHPKEGQNYYSGSREGRGVVPQKERGPWGPIPGHFEPNITISNLPRSERSKWTSVESYY
jgi:hypothetical protein